MSLCATACRPRKRHAHRAESAAARAEPCDGGGLAATAQQHSKEEVRRRGSTRRLGPPSRKERRERETARLASLAPRPGALPVHLHFRQQHSRCICILGITGATAFWVQRILPVHLHFGTLFPVRLIFGSDDSRCNCILQEVAPGATAFRRSAPGATAFWQQYSRCNCILPYYY